MSRNPQVFEIDGQRFTLKHRTTGAVVRRGKYLLGPASWDRVARQALEQRGAGGTNLYRAEPVSGRWAR